jgi:hypothetical protein
MEVSIMRNKQKLVLAGIIIFLFSPLFVKADVDIGFFYDKLAPYGEWVSVSPYGWVWSPADMSPGWRPYSDGRWVNSDYGLTYLSDYDWAWACYHYGRWMHHREYGWLWVPGDVWGPSWVAWRSGGGFIGWAPLPPDIGWSAGFGLDWGDFALEADLAPRFWCFVEAQWFFEPRLFDYLMVPALNRRCFERSENRTNYAFDGNRVHDRGIDVAELERATRRKAPFYTVAEASGENMGVRIRGHELLVFQPRITSLKSGRNPENVIQEKRLESIDGVMQRQQLEREKMIELQKRQWEKLQHEHLNEMKKYKDPAVHGEMAQQHENEKKAQAALHIQQMNELMMRQSREISTMNEQRKKK